MDNKNFDAKFDKKSNKSMFYKDKQVYIFILNSNKNNSKH